MSLAKQILRCYNPPVGLYAILIAGGMLPKSMRHLSSSPVKALLSVGNMTLLDRAAAAARNCGLFDGIAAVGNPEVQEKLPEGCVYIPMGETMVDNVANAYRHFGGDAHHYVVISPDLPFIDADSLAGFVAAARQSCEVGALYVTKEDFLRGIPGAPNRFVRLASGEVTLGSVFFATGAAIRKNIPLIREMYTARKRPWRLAVFLGWGVVWGLLTSRLRIETIERRLSLLMDSDVRAIRGSGHGLAYDIDTLENYEFALSLLNSADSGVSCESRQLAASTESRQDRGTLVQ